MKLLLPIAAILTVASAGRIYNNQPATAGYVQAQGILSTEPQTFTAQPHGIAIQQQLTARPQHVQQPTYATQLQAYPAQNQGYADQRGHQGENGARILRYQAENDGHNYMYAYETENGIRAEEAGTTQGKGVQAQGGYSYTGDDGQVYTVTYTADENGFRAQGAHLPTPPPIPEAIAKAIEQNAQDEANGFTDDGKYVAEQQQPAQELHQHQAPRYQIPRHQAQQYQVQQHHTQQFQVQQPQHYQVQQPQQQYQVQHVQLQPQVQYHQQTQQQAPQVQYQYEDYQQNYQVSPTPVQGHSYQ